MRYSKFTIRNYRAITGPLVIDVARQSLIPIIGVNESGKTTILQAIFAFDAANDHMNEGGRHLKDTSNLYRTTSGPCTVQAEIRVDRDDIIWVLANLEGDATVKAWAATVARKRTLPEVITITRDLETKQYCIDTPPLTHEKYGAIVGEAFVRVAPFILYFDDFRDKVDDRIEIPAEMPSALTGWLAIIERLFNCTDENLSVFKLAKMDVRQRKSAIAKVQRRLNETLTREWANFRLDEQDALELAIEFTPGAAGGQIKLEIVETDANGDRHYFFISDRSKGFFWFFNFVMKLEFNPKVLETSDGDEATVILLDEPGSYLHASAQARLCKKLRELSRSNRVIYCTHSHYLLNPDVIPLSSIRIAEKDGNGSIQVSPIFDYKGAVIERRTAFEPIIDALQIKPFVLDLSGDRVVIVEGIVDYYAFDMFRANRPIAILPSVGGDSIRFYVSLMLAWQVRFWALWDNDEEGRRHHSKAAEIFGDEIASRRFRLLPVKTGVSKRILQDLFDGADLRMLRKELKLADNSSFDKAIAALYFSPRRSELVGSISSPTKAAFEEVFASLGLE